MNNDPSYYAIIPAVIRYDRNLTPNEKLFYGEITALSNRYGYCWASNRYFAHLYHKSDQTITVWIDQLEKEGFIHKVTIRKGLLKPKRCISIQPINKGLLKKELNKSKEVLRKIGRPSSEKYEQVKLSKNHIYGKHDRKYSSNTTSTNRDDDVIKIKKSIQSIYDEPLSIDNERLLLYFIKKWKKLEKDNRIISAIQITARHHQVHHSLPALLNYVTSVIKSLQKSPQQKASHYSSKSISFSDLMKKRQNQLNKRKHDLNE